MLGDLHFPKIYVNAVILTITEKDQNILQYFISILLSYKLLVIIFSKYKGKTPKEKYSNVVDKIECSCNNCWIAKPTKQYLKRHLNQHKNDCKESCRNEREKTTIATNHFEPGHHLNFYNVEIFYRENNYMKKNISEM